MIGILLINMGGAENPVELKQFYRKMFLDKHIIPAPFFIRNLLSIYISKTRFKTGWMRYEMIGGTPIKKDTLTTVFELQKILGSDYSVKEAYSYSNPFISESIDYLYQKNIRKIIAIPLYPQASITTTSSAIADINNAKKKYQNLEINIIKEFFENTHFISFWSDLIIKHISDNNLQNPLLIFSAHSIPISCIKTGDIYQKSIEESARLISDNCKLNYGVSYQSGMNPKTWIGPDTKDFITSQVQKGIKEIIIIPISFVGENLETLYDLDKVIVPWCKESYNINISRVRIPVVHPEFLSLLLNIIKEN